MKFEKNVGTIDMAVRLLLGVLLLAVGVAENPVVTAPAARRMMMLIALIPLASAVSRFCPLYTFAGINTCRK